MTAPAARAVGRRYRDDRFDAWIVPIVAGEQYVTAEADEQISTVLGSCIAICACDVTAGVGGMNHILLPDHVPAALEALVRALRVRGADPRALEVKLVGGSRSLPGAGDVGAANVARARVELDARGLAIVTTDLGGCGGRRLRYHAASGRTFVRRIDTPRCVEPPREAS